MASRKRQNPLVNLTKKGAIIEKKYNYGVSHVAKRLKRKFLQRHIPGVGFVVLRIR